MKILLIAYYFPPDSSSGSFRPIVISNHLIRKDCKIYILTVRITDFLPAQPQDVKLLLKVSSGVEIFRTPVYRFREKLLSFRDFLRKVSGCDVDGAGNNKYSNSNDHENIKSKNNTIFHDIKNIITDLLALPDPQVGWIPSACVKGRKIVRENGIDIIFATGSPWSSFIIGSILSKLTGVPLVCDFRDPWVSNPNFTLKTYISRKIETKLESMIVNRSRLLVSNTEELREDFISRYPSLNHQRFITAPNGFDNYMEPIPANNSSFTLVHAGELYLSRSPLHLLEAIHSLIESEKITFGKFKLILVGGFQINDDRIDAILRKPVMQNIVSLLPRISYAEALEYQRRADALLLIQPNFPLQVPRKLYEYIALQKTVLALTEHKGATARLIETHQLGIVAQSRDEIEDALLRIFKNWEKGIKETFKGSTTEFLNASIADKLYFAMQQIRVDIL